MPASAVILMVILSWLCVGNVIYFIIRWYRYGRQLELKGPTSAGCGAVIESVKGAGIAFHRHVTNKIKATSKNW